MPSPAKHLLGFLAFPVLALACALLANAGAGPSRRLAWIGGPPPDSLPAPIPLAPPTPPAAVSEESSREPAPAPNRPLPSAARPAPHPGVRKGAPGTPDRFAPDPTAVMREINLTDAEGAFDRHIAFLDARRTPDYLEGHVPGAVSLPVWEDGLEARITRWEAGSALAPKDPIVVYCSAGCEDSRLLAGKLVALGYRNLLIYTGGFPEWLGASRPVAAGARP